MYKCLLKQTSDNGPCIFSMQFSVQERRTYFESCSKSNESVANCKPLSPVPSAMHQNKAQI